MNAVSETRRELLSLFNEEAIKKLIFEDVERVRRAQQGDKMARRSLHMRYRSIFYALYNTELSDRALDEAINSWVDAEKRTPFMQICASLGYILE